MSVLLLHLDGSLPNLALMRLAAYYRGLGHDVELRRADNPRLLEPRLGDPAWDHVYASAIFGRTRPSCERVKVVYPHAIIGGTGWDVALSLADVGVPPGPIDYSDYPEFRKSIGFTQRGCRFRCKFCCVPVKEGGVRGEGAIADIWRGEPWPRELILLDNDFFGQPEWRERIREIREGGFKVSFVQGINARMLNAETAAAIASVEYRDDDMETRRIYTAWDNRKDAWRLFKGLRALKHAGVKPDNMMVYMLVGFWPGETPKDREDRRRVLRKFGARPYPMPYERTRELVGFQRWVIGAYDKRIPWAAWERNGYRPEGLSDNDLPLFDGPTCA